MTTTTAVSPPPMRNWITGCLLCMLAFGVCWTGAIVCWRAQEGDPGTGELLFYLFILPAALLAGALAARNRLSVSMPAAVPITTQSAEPPAPPAALPLAIIATAVRSPYGAAVDALAGALRGQRARPLLDAALRDDAAFPRATARCADGAGQDLNTAIADWLAAAGSTVHFDEAAARALVLATGVTAELAAHAAHRWLDDGAKDRKLQLAPVLPAGWMREQRAAASLWLQHTAAQHWPAAQLTLVPSAGTDCFDAVPALLLTSLAAPGAAAPMATLVIACASHLDPAAAASLPAGAVPGEGAAGLLLVRASTGLAMFPLIEPVHAARRDTSADTSRGPVAPVLANLAQQALAAAGLDAGAVAMIVADTGPRPTRMLELLGYAGMATPQLGSDEDVVAYGHASGSCGAVPALTALALAGFHAGQRNGPVLWLANEDPFQRCAAVVRPPPPP